MFFFELKYRKIIYFYFTEFVKLLNKQISKQHLNYY